MPRSGRVACGTGLYHVTVRGCARQVIFEDTDDRTFFLRRLDRYSQDARVDVIAYCLMDNHVHLVLYDPEGVIGEFMHRLCTAYARHFNDRHGRSGHLFQDRFASEPIEDDRYLLTAIRYVHDNPEKAKLAERNEYPWSSYREYVSDRGLTSREYVYGLVGGAAGFMGFSSSGEDEGALARIMRLDGVDALEVARVALGGRDPFVIGASPKPIRDADLRAIAAAGLNVSDISRVTGVSRGVVARVIRD